MFVAEIGSSLFVPDNFIRRLHPYTSMIGSQYNPYIFFCYFFQCLVQWRMLKPTGSNATITYFIAGQLFQHFHFCSCMAQHIHEIVNNYIQVIIQQVMDIIYQIQTCLVVYYFSVRNFQIIFS